MGKLTILVATALTLALMLASVGTASADPCAGSCEGTPAGGPNTLAFAHADAHALDVLTDATERRGLR